MNTEALERLRVFRQQVYTICGMWSMPASGRAAMLKPVMTGGAIIIIRAALTASPLSRAGTTLSS